MCRHELLYVLESLWLLKQDMKRFDGFYAWCLRRISKVLPAFVSRITNASILERFKTLPLSTKLCKRQLDLYGRLVLQPENALTRRVAQQLGSFELVDWKPKRRIGRPCFRWPTMVHSMILQIVGSRETVQRLDAISGPAFWRSMGSRYY